jgi:hypothetical protein
LMKKINDIFTSLVYLSTFLKCLSNHIYISSYIIIIIIEK